MKLRELINSGICSVEGEGDAGAAGGGGAGGTGDAGQGSASWYATLDAETQGVLQTKGWDKLTPDQAVAQAVAAHREAEKFLGAPKDQLVRRPDPADPASVAAFWQQFGKPSSKDQYDFSGVKFTDGTALDDGFVTFMRDTADRLNLPKEAATEVAAGIIKFMEQADAAEAGERAAAVATQTAELKKEWGNNFEAHKFVAKQGALKVGISEGEFDAMFETPGGARMLEVFRKIGDMSGEGRFVAGSGSANTGMLTRQQALAEKSALMADDAWVTKYNKGDVQAVGKMTALNTIIVADVTEADFFS